MNEGLTCAELVTFAQLMTKANTYQLNFLASTMTEEQLRRLKYD